MSEGEATAFLHALQDAGEVAVLPSSVSSEGGISLLPEEVLAGVSQHLAQAAQEEHAKAALLPSAPPAAAASAVALSVRPEVWAFVSLFYSIQLFTLAYFTFIVCGWDMMEPICYFITSFSSWVWLGWAIHQRRGEDWEAVDTKYQSSSASSSSAAAAVE